MLLLSLYGQMRLTLSSVGDANLMYIAFSFLARSAETMLSSVAVRTVAFSDDAHSSSSFPSVTSFDSWTQLSLVDALCPLSIHTIDTCPIL